jgi:RHS repeat-associated protein
MKGGTLSYIHQDSLSSTSVTSDVSVSLVGSIKYFPFGDCRNSTGAISTDKLFTGQRLDSTGLYYYGARYYDASIGRFISPDTIVPSPANPQSLNRYSYCLNNPLKYVDPSGHNIDPENDEAMQAYLEFIRDGGADIAQMMNESETMFHLAFYNNSLLIMTDEQLAGLTMLRNGLSGLNQIGFFEGIGATWATIGYWPGIEVKGNNIYNSKIEHPGGSRYFDMHLGKYKSIDAYFHMNSDIGLLKELDGQEIPGMVVRYVKMAQNL